MPDSISLPSPTNGFGIITVGTTSVALSTLTLGPNSNAYKQPFVGALMLINSPNSAGMAYVAPLGGTATNSCLPLGPGASISLNIGGTTASPSLISDSTSTIVAVW